MLRDPVTDQERIVLRDGFQGPPPSSDNLLSMLVLEKDGVQVMGERIGALVRARILVAVARRVTENTIRGGNAGEYGEIPDIELSHDYFLTERRI